VKSPKDPLNFGVSKNKQPHTQPSQAIPAHEVRGGFSFLATTAKSGGGPIHPSPFPREFQPFSESGSSCETTVGSRRNVPPQRQLTQDFLRGRHPRFGI